MKAFPVAEAFEVGSSFIYGRAADINRIIDLLCLEDETNLNSTVVCIVADRGTGRTTLLHLLYRILSNAFDTRKFVSIPENFNEKVLMRVVIESLTDIPCDITDSEVLKETTKEELKDQRLLLLLDNFENKSQKCWDLLFALIKVCKEKSAVVVTATREVVAKVKGPTQFYFLNNLSNEWCWMIFKQGIFYGGNLNAGTELADIGKLIVAKCRNVTLCVKVISGLLRHFIFITDARWRALLDDNFWDVDEVDGDILPALRVCYEYLPSHLKQCFKYCSLFPKEFIFSKEHLVRI
jgi:NB-ARC domain